jgi:hypothetical protein
MATQPVNRKMPALPNFSITLGFPICPILPNLSLEVNSREQIKMIFEPRTATTDQPDAAAVPSARAPLPEKTRNDPEWMFAK